MYTLEFLLTKHSQLNRFDPEEIAVTVPENGIFTLGRGADNAIKIYSTIVSLRHGIFTYANEVLTYTDASSTGTYYNGTRCDKQIILPLNGILEIRSTFAPIPMERLQFIRQTQDEATVRLSTPFDAKNNIIGHNKYQ